VVTIDVPRQGEIWWAEADDKRRPVLVVTRSEAIPVLTTLIVAPVTRTFRNIPTEVALDETHGLTVECVASFDNLQAVRRSALTTRIGSLGSARRQLLCRALASLADC
jgi:mRNA interferase MazF